MARIQTDVAGRAGLVVQGASGQTAELFLVQNDASSNVFKVGADGSTGISTGATALTAKLQLHASAGAVGQIIRAASSQAADLQQWQDSGGASLVSVGPDGTFTTTTSTLLATGGGVVRIGATAVPANTKLFVSNGAANITPVAVRGFAGQSVNIFSIQDSSGSNISGFNATGNLFYSNSTFTSTLSSATLTANRSLVLPNEDGTLCVQGSTNCGFAPSSASGSYIQLAPTTAQTDATTNNSIFINKTDPTGDFLRLQNSGTTAARILSSGTVSTIGRGVFGSNIADTGAQIGATSYTAATVTAAFRGYAG
jgi:hypothetical protein